MGKNYNRRPLTFRTLEESLQDIQQLSKREYTKSKNWDLGQICSHLNKTMRMSFDGADFGLPFFVQPFVRQIFMRTVRKGKQYHGAPKAPAQVTPDESVDIEQEIQEYETLVRRLYEDEKEILPKHPIVGKLSPEDWRLFHAWHAAHHLSFLHPIDSNSVLQSET